MYGVRGGPKTPLGCDVTGDHSRTALHCVQQRHVFRRSVPCRTTAACCPPPASLRFSASAHPQLRALQHRTNSK